MIKKRGFTLVELLTVVVIIALMSMITLKVMGYVNYKTGKSRAARDIERVKHALAEYYHTYGCFPPVNTMVWKRPMRDANGNVIGASVKPASGWNEEEGLCKYMYGDDSTAKWNPYIEGLQYEEKEGNTWSDPGGGGGGGVKWSNLVTRILDPWGNDYVYTCNDPYQAYQLYSKGPDASDPSDDVGKSWAE